MPLSNRTRSQRATTGRTGHLPLRADRFAFTCSQTFTTVRFPLFLLLTLLPPAAAIANEPAAATATSMGQRIDAIIDARLAEESIEAAPLVGDAAFLRRVMLDLAGRIPTARELHDFLRDRSSDKRVHLVDALLASADFAYHQRNELDLLLLAPLRQDDAWREYLLAAAKENRPWDQLFREIMLPEQERPGEEGPAAFLRERVRDLDDLTNDTAVLFFGVNIGCAKCHDHPLVADWKQDHYFGMASFFKRTYATKSKLVGEKLDGRPTFKTVLGEEKQAQFMFLTGTTVEEPELTLEEESRKQLQEAIKKAQKEDGAQPPLVEFSPREELVTLALDESRRQFFSRNIVNRIWARLMGRGLVMPLDQLHADNPSSHPGLLELLADELREHDYDLKHLIRGIVLSGAYARSCEWPAGQTPPPPQLYAVGHVRPLTPRQYALSLEVAATNPDHLPGLEKPEDWEKRREVLESRSSHFASLFPIPKSGFQVGVDEALLISNSRRFEEEFLRAGDERIVGRVSREEDPQQCVAIVFHSVLGRAPTTREQEAVESYLQERQDRREAAIQQIVWALMSSPEFRFNH